MSICLWATYRQSSNKSVPAPVDTTTPLAPWWWDHLAAQCREFAEVGGYSALMLPPVHKTNSGSSITGDGYGFQGDHYDIGSKNQSYSYPTRFGTRQQLLRLCAVAAANGLEIYHDLVLHQIQGGSSETWPGADGTAGMGRFPMRPGYFCNSGVGQAVHDRVMGDPDWPFGVEFAYANALPPGELKALTIAAVDWLMRTTGATGTRIDAAKGLNAGFLKDLAESGAMRGKFACMEFADGNADNLYAAVYNGIFDGQRPGVEGTMSAFDFDGHYNKIKAMCEGAGRFDMRQLAGGFSNRAPLRAATFVDNPDTDTNGFAQVAFNKAAGYFLIMTAEGYPFTYYKDRSADAGCYDLRASIDNYAWLNNMLASGGTQTRYADHNLYVYERMGGRHLLCAINNDPNGGWRREWVQTGFAPSTCIHDYTGHADDLWTNADGWTYLSVPQNVNGLGTVAYAPVGLDGVGLPMRGGPITQTFFGAADLDVGPLHALVPTTIETIWVEAGHHIDLDLTLPGGRAGTCVMHVQGPDGVTSSFGGRTARALTRARGWHVLSATWTPTVGLLETVGLRGTPPTHDYELVTTYTAPKGI